MSLEPSRCLIALLGKAAHRLWLLHRPWATDCGEESEASILGEWFVRFQLILQFPATTTKDFDVLVALEEELTRSLPPIAKVDGHDFGMGEFNIFVLTDGPKEAFEVAKVLIQQRQPQPQLRAAYREMAEDEFVILWPLGLAEFTVA